MNDKSAVMRPAARFHETLMKRSHGPLVMGIVNVTPDSFSDGGRFAQAPEALRHAQALLADGADLLDIGGESTRPGFSPVSPEEEWARLLPIFSGLSASGTVLSVDTTKAWVAAKAISAGALIVNDVWGFQADPDMAHVVSQSEAYAVLMHNRVEVDGALDVVADWRRFFDASLELAQRAGVESGRLILDPGVGFGKTPDQNVQAIARIRDLKAEYGLPVLLGLSRKSMFGHFLGRSVDERLAGTLSANLYGARRGADIVRVHDVREHVDAFGMQHILERGE